RIVGPQTPRTSPRLALCSHRMRIAPRAMSAGALLALGLTAGTVAAAAGAPGLELSACELEHPLRLTVVAAECGVLSVAENPHDPAGRHIPLHVARVPTLATTPPVSPCRTWSVCARPWASRASTCTAPPTARGSRSTTCAASRSACAR